LIAVPGSDDLAASRRDVFARWFGPERWWFARHGCVYVGVHYASDVTAGALAGAASDLAQPVVTYLRRSATTKIVVPRAQARLASDIGDGSKPGQASGCG